MPHARIEFHDDLLGLLGRASRASGVVEVETHDGRSVKDGVESAGVPHTEIASIDVGGHPVTFEYALRPGDRIDVRGFREPADSSGRLPLAPPRPIPAQFVADGHLGRLARYLRLLGFDVLYDRAASDDRLASTSVEEGRILLTRDRGLLKRSIVCHGRLIRHDDPAEQLVEVVDRFDLISEVRAFTRCVVCNGPIERVPRSSVVEALRTQPRTLRFFTDFGRCRDCGRIYWPGSHFDRMSRLVSRVIDDAGRLAR